MEISRERDHWVARKGRAVRGEFWDGDEGYGSGWVQHPNIGGGKPIPVTTTLTVWQRMLIPPKNPAPLE